MYKFANTYQRKQATKLVHDLFEDVCVETQSMLSDKALVYSRERKGLELSRLEIRASDYTDVVQFRNDYFITNFLSKWKGLVTGIDTEAAALKAFKSQELVCRETNLRIKTRSTAMLDPIFHRAQQLIAKVLGPFDRSLFNYTERWGPGATTDMSRSMAYLDSKISEFPLQVTRTARPFMAESIQKDLHWSYVVLGQFPEGDYSLLPSVFDVVEGSTITTVPKNAKTDRTIAIEPRGNMWLQKAVGSFLRKRLKRVWIDLDSQVPNQKLAQHCEMWRLATIDLSMASDSLTSELVYELLPIDWAIYLDNIRSKWYTLNSVVDRFEKFSSMGNGFTFELETLIFWALTKASMSDEKMQIAVYGDDIVVPQEDVPVLTSTLAYAGFKVNLDKSFWDGRFFESCGRHFFGGVDVTPCYQKEEITNESELIRLANRLVRFLLRSNDGDRLIGPVLKPWETLIRPYISVDGCPIIPLGMEGDDGYLVRSKDFTPKRWKRSYGNQWNVVISKREHLGALREDALLAYSLRLAAGAPRHFSVMDCVILGRELENEAPFNGALEWRKSNRSYSMTTRWREPSWEFALD